MKTKPIVTYFLFAFGIAWIFELILIVLDQLGLLGQNVILFSGLMAMGVIGPGLGAFFALKQEKRIAGVKEYFRYMLHSKNVKRTLSVIVLTMLGTVCLTYILCPRSEARWYMFLVYIPYMTVGGGIEEFGWRGYLHPYLKERLGMFPAVLMLGAIWALWHVPLWFIASTAQASENFISFLVLCICLSIVLGVIREITGNVLACILTHAWTNVLYAMFIIDLSSINGKVFLEYGIMAVVSGLIYFIMKPKTGAKE